MKVKEQVLLASIFVTFICLILYEAGVFKVEAPKELFADGTQKSLILKHNEETVIILPGSKMNVAWNSSEGELTQTGSVVYTTIDTSLIYVTSSGNPITIPVDQIQELIVQKGSRAGKYAKKGFLWGGAVGAFFGLISGTSGEDPSIILCSGLACGLPGGLIGGIAGALWYQTQHHLSD